MKHIRFAMKFQSQQIYKYKEHIKVSTKNTNSVILTLAEHLLQYHQIYPPMDEEYYKQCRENIKSYYNPLFQEWADYLVKCVFNHWAVVYQETFYVFFQLGHMSGELMKKYSEEFQMMNKKQYESFKGEVCQSIFQIPKIERKNRSCILNFHPVQTDPKFGPKKNNVAIFLGLLYNNQTWQKYNITTQLPTLKELLTFDRIILTGSKLSVIDRIKPIQETIHNVMQVYKTKENVKIIGVCFGHQLISQYSKSAVVRKVFTKGIENIKFDKDLIEKYSFLEPIKAQEGELRCSQIHQDFVEEVPLGFNLLATSSSCKIQSLLSQDGRILTSQFHSEYLYQYLKQLQKDVQLYTSNPSFVICSDELVTAELQDRTVVDSNIFIEVLRLFLL